MAPPDAPAPAPLVGGRGKRPDAKTALLPARAVADVAALTVLVGVPALAEVVGATEPASARRPRRVLGAPVAAALRRRPARVRGVGP